MFQSSYASPIPDLLRDLQGILSTLPLIGDSVNLEVPWLAEGFWARITPLIVSTWQWTPSSCLCCQRDARHSRRRL